MMSTPAFAGKQDRPKYHSHALIIHLRRNALYLFSAWILVLFWTGPLQAAELQLLAGAGLRQPTDELVRAFQQDTGHRVLVEYGGSGMLLARILSSGRGDLYMPGSFHYIEQLRKKDKVHSFRTVVAHTPVIGVNIRKADRIKTFEDLSRPDMRLALGDPKAMAFGRTAMDILEKSGQKDAILKNVVTYGVTVKQLTMYVANGDVDAAIIGRADAFQNRDRIKIVPIPSSYFQPETVAVAVLTFSQNPEMAANLRDYLSSKHAVGIFEKFGFLPPGKETP